MLEALFSNDKWEGGSYGSISNDVGAPPEAPRGVDAAAAVSTQPVNAEKQNNICVMLWGKVYFKGTDHDSAFQIPFLSTPANIFTYLQTPPILLQRTTKTGGIALSKNN